MPLLSAAGKAEWREHWPVVFAAMLATSFPVVYLYATSNMIPHLQTELGWSRAQISSGPLIVAFAAVFLGPIIGMAIDRYGARRIGLTGATFYLLSLAGLSTTTSAIASWWALWFLVAVGAAAASPAVWTTGVSSLFYSARGMALAVTLTGTGLGSMLVPATTQALVSRVEWRGTYIVLALLWAVVLVPLVLFFRSAKDGPSRNAVKLGPPPAMLEGMAARQAMRSARFAKLMLGACGVGLICNGMAVNMVPILISTGWTAGRAAAIAALVGVGSIGGRLLGGILLDHVHGAYVGAMSAMVLCAATAAFAVYPHSEPVVLFGVFCVGLTIGVEYDAVAYLAARYFGMRAFGTVFGALSGATVLMSGLGPLFTNFLYDVTGGYGFAMGFFVPLALFSAAMFLWLGPYPELAGASVAQEEPS